MQKKLLAVAVAGALALPGAALAASSVTITGFFKVSFASIKVSPQPPPGSAPGTAGGRNSQDRVQDESSRIYFRVVEDLGGGLQALGQVDMRFTNDQGALSAAGANWVGLRSKSWGSIKAGRADIHYIYTEDQTYSRGGTLKAVNTSIIGFSNSGANAIANNSRTPNLLMWDSPNWKGFTIKAAYSSNPYGVEADIASGNSSGYAWNLAPQYNAKNWGIGYSYWQGRNDGAGFGTTTTIQCTGVGVPAPGCVGTGPLVITNAAGQVKTRGDRVNAHYQWGGFRLGFVWDSAKITDAGAGTPTAILPVGVGSEISKRDAWSIPARYSWGKHNVFGHYSVAKDDKATVYANTQTGAKMFAIGYSYSLSKRTKAALTYAKISNDIGARYNLFTSAGGLGSPDSAVAPGQDPSTFALTLTHSF